jgi:putative inorganic carbon (hco3(-)) transporter
MIGIDSSLAVQAPRLLTLETAVFGAYLAFSMLAARELKNDPAAFFPRQRFQNALLAALAAGLAAALASSLGVDLSILALELALALLLSFFHPALATGNFVLLLFLRPWEIALTENPLFQAIPRTFGIAALASAAIYLLSSGHLKVRVGPPTVLLLGFALWTFLSTFISSDPGSVQGNFFDLFFKSVVLFLLLSQAVRNPDSFRLLKAALVFAALGISLVSLYRTMNTPALSGERLGTFGMLADPNDTSAVMIMIFPFAFYFLKRADRSLFLRLICLATLASSLALLYYAKSRGALLALLLTISLQIFLSIKNRRVAIPLMFCALLLFLPLSSAFQRSESDLSQSQESRIIYWTTATYMAIRNPLLGVGFGGYPGNFERYAPRFIESGLRTAHSSWFLALAETGFVGFGLFSSLFAWMLRKSWQLRRDYPELFFATFGYGIAMSFLSHTYSIYLYLLLGMVYSGSRIAEDGSA